MANVIRYARPMYEVELLGGPAVVEIAAGATVRTHPASDLFMQGAKHAEVRRIVGGDEPYLLVRPLIGGAPVRGKLRRLSVDHVLVDEKGIG